MSLIFFGTLLVASVGSIFLVGGYFYIKFIIELIQHKEYIPAFWFIVVVLSMIGFIGTGYALDTQKHFREKKELLSHEQHQDFTKDTYSFDH